MTHHFKKNSVGKILEKWPKMAYNRPRIAKIGFYSFFGKKSLVKNVSTMPLGFLNFEATLPITFGTLLYEKILRNGLNRSSAAKMTFFGFFYINK